MNNKNRQFMKFVKYLQLTEISDEYIKNIATNFRTVFFGNNYDFKLINNDDFINDVSLFGYITEVIETDVDLKKFKKKKKLDNTNPIAYDDGDYDYYDGDEVGKLSFSTKVHIFESIIKYTSFLRPSDYYSFYKKSVSAVSRFSKKSKLQRQGFVSAYVQDNVFPVYIISNLLKGLRDRQNHINRRIFQWLQWGELAMNERELKLFGRWELQPFIELAIRFTVLPMSLIRLRNVTVDLSVKSSPFMPIHENYSGDVIISNGEKLTLLSTITTKGTDIENIVTRDIYPALSFYIFFHLQYCTRTNVTRLNKTNGRHFLFNGIEGGEWKQDTIPRDIRTYAKDRLKLPDEILHHFGLFRKKRTKYIENSYIFWLATNSERDPYTIEKNAVATRRLNIANEEKQNRNDVLRSLRFTKKSIEHILPHLLEEMCDMDHKIQLKSIPDYLFSLWIQMNRFYMKNPEKQVDNINFILKPNIVSWKNSSLFNNLVMIK